MKATKELKVRIRVLELDVNQNTDGTDVRARRAVPQVGDLAQVLGQVVLVVGLVGQLQVPTKRVQPDRISPADRIKKATDPLF